VSVVDDLLASPGLYLGVDTVADSDLRGAARLVVTPLPGGSGVTLDFELGPEGSPFPMKVLLSVPAPGRLRHSWWYGRPGGEAIERDVSELTRTT
jgi:hypothetical protein